MGVSIYGGVRRCGVPIGVRGPYMGVPIYGGVRIWGCTYMGVPVVCGVPIGMGGPYMGVP